MAYVAAVLIRHAEEGEAASSAAAAAFASSGFVPGLSAPPFGFSIVPYSRLPPLRLIHPSVYRPETSGSVSLPSMPSQRFLIPVEYSSAAVAYRRAVAVAVLARAAAGLDLRAAGYRDTARRLVVPRSAAVPAAPPRPTADTLPPEMFMSPRFRRSRRRCLRRRPCRPRQLPGRRIS